MAKIYIRTYLGEITTTLPTLSSPNVARNPDGATIIGSIPSGATKMDMILLQTTFGGAHLYSTIYKESPFFAIHHDLPYTLSSYKNTANSNGQYYSENTGFATFYYSGVLYMTTYSSDSSINIRFGNMGANNDMFVNAMSTLYKAYTGYGTTGNPVKIITRFYA